MLGAYKARLAPFNVNYRYVDEELEYLFDNADAKAVIYHASFAPTLARIRDEAAEGPCCGCRWTTARASRSARRARLRAGAGRGRARAEPAGLAPDDLYILYTGGTTGMPKGVLWRQEDILRAAMYPGEVDSLEQIVERVKKKTRGVRALPTPPFMHGASHWAAFNMWHVGGTIVVQSEPERLDPADIWCTVEREKVNVLNMVGDAFGRPLVDELRRGATSSPRCGASHGRRDPHAPRSSRTSSSCSRRSRSSTCSAPRRAGSRPSKISSGESRATTGDFAMSPDNVVLKADLSGVAGARLRRAGLAGAPRQRCRSATTGTPRRPPRPSRWWTGCATWCRGTGPRWKRTARCACSAGTP